MNKPKDIKIIILLGQSNMEGHSCTSYLDRHFPPELVNYYTSPFKTEIAYNCDNGNNESYDEFVPVRVGQGYDSTRFGPEIGIAAHLEKAQRSDEFKIIKFAIGGTSLEVFWRSPSSGIPGLCYVFATNYAHRMLTKLKRDGYNPTVSAILYMQGENDSVDGGHLQYEKYLQNLVNDLRNEFKDYAPKAGIYFIDGLINDAEFWTHHEIINTAKRNVAKSDPKNIIVDTLTPQLSFSNEPDFEIDWAHYDSDGTIKLGHLFGEAVTEHIK
jgi:hypothetical protein